MTRIFNIASDTFIRQRLRRSIPDAEITLWKHLQKKQLRGIKFRRQYGVAHFVIDFYCPKYKLAIEIDGPSHMRKKATAYDHARQQIIESFGIKVLRFTNEEIFTKFDWVLEKISKECLKFSSQNHP